MKVRTSRCSKHTKKKLLYELEEEEEVVTLWPSSVWRDSLAFIKQERKTEQRKMNLKSVSSFPSLCRIKPDLKARHLATRRTASEPFRER